MREPDPSAAEVAAAHQAIGRFIVEFSQLQFSVRFVLAAALRLEDKHYDLITAPYDFATLCNVTREALIVELPEQKARIEELFKRCFKINDARVKVAHGTWTLEGTAAWHTDRRRWQTRTYFEGAGELSILSEETQQLWTTIQAELLDLLPNPRGSER